MTLYRLSPKGGVELQGMIQEKYVNSGFAPISVTVGNVECVMTHGIIAREGPPDWVDHLTTLTGSQLDVSNQTAAGLLLVPVDGFVFALSWGMGFLLFDQKYVDPGFGLRFAIRRADPDEVRSLTVHALDTLPRTAKTSVLGGAKIGAFGMEELGEVLSRLVGRVPADGLSCATEDGKTWITVRGSDALSLPLGRTPNLLLSDLAAINEVVENGSPVAELEHLEDTHPLRGGSDLVKQLDSALSERLALGTPRLALSWPAGWEDEQGEASRFELSKFREEFNGTRDELELEDLILPIADKLPKDRLRFLKRGRIHGVKNDGSVTSRAIAADKWITFEHVHEGRRYVFHRGQWYDIGGEYLARLHGKVSRILAIRFAVALPAWPVTEKKRRKTNEKYIDPVVEGDYNLLVEDRNSADFVCLDKKLVRCEQHPRGFESCDLLGPGNELIHVKDLADSVSASHLFNQALVSAEALRQVDAVDAFRRVVNLASGGKREIPAGFRPSKVVLAFAGRAATPNELFTFSQVTLHRLAVRLDVMNVPLEISQIDASAEVMTEQALIDVRERAKSR
ncbi:DUF6119 family protein [Actinoplanes sp. NPDC049802]|uniref:DUF6119 family protein n=1 Tax=Actinoplanes sp. NPDC049802 TaxID=3154742 RepID=UPI00340C10A4